MNGMNQCRHSWNVTDQKGIKCSGSSVDLHRSRPARRIGATVRGDEGAARDHTRRGPRAVGRYEAADGMIVPGKQGGDGSNPCLWHATSSRTHSSHRRSVYMTALSSRTTSLAGATKR